MPSDIKLISSLDESVSFPDSVDIEAFSFESHLTSGELVSCERRAVPIDSDGEGEINLINGDYRIETGGRGFDFTVTEEHVDIIDMI